MEVASKSDQVNNENDPLYADRILLSEILDRIKAGLPRTIGFAVIGSVVATLVGAIAFWVLPCRSDARVTFAFAGFERGRYPDGSTFLPDDLRAPDIINDALSRHRSLSGSNQAEVRSSVAISGLVPPNIIKERDRMRATGQIPPPYFPDEYELTFSGIKGIHIHARDQELLLQDIVSSYLEKFRRTYMQMPPQFGKAFESLGGSDYFEYELILNQDLQTMEAFLRTLANETTEENKEKGERNAGATFRSSKTGYSFNELLGHTRNFTHLKLTEVMGLIQSTGLSRNRQTALIKMDYRVRILSEEEKRLADEESMIRDLMSKVEARNQSYVLGIKSQNASKADTPYIDQGLLDTLVQNDSFNFLVRRAVDAGLRVREISAQKNELIERSERMRSFLDKAEIIQAGAQRSVDESLAILQSDYKDLLALVTSTYEDYTKQQLGTAVRLSGAPRSDRMIGRVGPFSAAGAGLGLLLGLGMSLVERSRFPRKA